MDIRHLYIFSWNRRTFFWEMPPISQRTKKFFSCFWWANLCVCGIFLKGRKLKKSFCIYIKMHLLLKQASKEKTSKIEFFNICIFYSMLVIWHPWETNFQTYFENLRWYSPLQIPSHDRRQFLLNARRLESGNWRNAFGN